MTLPLVYCCAGPALRGLSWTWCTVGTSPGRTRLHGPGVEGRGYEYAPSLTQMQSAP